MSLPPGFLPYLVFRCVSCAFLAVPRVAHDGGIELVVAERGVGIAPHRPAGLHGDDVRVSAVLATSIAGLLAQTAQEHRGP